MDEKKLTPEESLTIIRKAITNFKVNYRENAGYFLRWGWILTLASFSNFVILRILQSREAYDLMGPLSLGNWVLFALIGFIIQLFMERKITRQKKVYSHLEGYIRNIWIVAAAGFFVGSLVCIQLQISPPPIMLLIAGIATTSSGLLIKFKPVIFGGIVFFVFSIATSFVFDEYIALLTGAAILLGYVVPGYYLKSAKE